jgi:SAM-dependent methyltransferase
MDHSAQKNADRFKGFAGLYENARPAMPQRVVDIVRLYLCKTPGLVVDMGCGTGLSTVVWAGRCREVIGIEPSADMLAIAAAKQAPGVSFLQAFSHDTGLAGACADAVVCSQSFHWMEPVSTLAEAGRILNSGGVFATVDCDWPPVCGFEAELAYTRLMDEVYRIEDGHPALRGASIKWDKENHLGNIKKSGLFRYAREVVFAHTESCTAGRLIGLALSQGGLQSVLKACPELITPEVERFAGAVTRSFGENTFDVDYCYRMRIGVR